jgi:HEPN domain-containing protein
MADEDWSTVLILKAAGKRNACVFYTHLSVEKSLKALIAETSGAVPPLSHDLVFLASRIHLDMPATVKTLLGRLSRQGNLARYAQPDHYAEDYCATLIADADEAIRWLRQKLS